MQRAVTASFGTRLLSPATRAPERSGESRGRRWAVMAHLATARPGAPLSIILEPDSVDKPRHDKEETTSCCATTVWSSRVGAAGDRLTPLIYAVERWGVPPAEVEGVDGFSAWLPAPVQRVICWQSFSRTPAKEDGSDPFDFTGGIAPTGCGFAHPRALAQTRPTRYRGAGLRQQARSAFSIAHGATNRAP
jgi:hypothetical protein